MESFKVRMPIKVQLGKVKKRTFYLNLNIYRLQVGHLINNIKKEYHRIACGVLPTGYRFENFELEYVLYLPNKLRRDISNVCSVVDKNFCDSLVKNGNVPDDNYEHLKRVVYQYGGYDEAKKGYVDVTVKEAT